jgi:hypothetical protein
VHREPLTDGDGQNVHDTWQDKLELKWDVEGGEKKLTFVNEKESSVWFKFFEPWQRKSR